jgi:pilus assembly protein CpaB
MKAARISVLAVALAAGGAAAFLIGSDEVKRLDTPLAQIATTDVLIAKSDIGMGTAISSQDLRLGTLSLALRSLLDTSKASDEDRKRDINNVLFGVSNT